MFESFGLGMSLGLLGLIGVAILILIYILKPNYQQKSISSTYVWKLSLRYRKKRVPISKFRNILIIICQISIISVAAFILAQPFLASAMPEQRPESILIIDASASMRAQTDGVTRFERAVERARESAHSALATEGGRVSIILAGQTAVSLVTRTEFASIVNQQLDTLIFYEEGQRQLACTFGVADIDGAMVLAEEILFENPAASVVLFTATEFADYGNVIIEDMSLSGEWNAAILDAEAMLIENLFVFRVTAARFGYDGRSTVSLTVNGVNGEPMTIHENIEVDFFDDEPVVIYFDNLRIHSFSDARVAIEEDDSFPYDNEFFLYGITRPTLSVLYVSYPGNDFFTTIISVLQAALRDRWHITLTESEPGEIEYRGFDLYIFEHFPPRSLPTDGVVFLVNPTTEPINGGFGLGGRVFNRDGFTLTRGQEHGRLMAEIDPSAIQITAYRPIVTHEHFIPLMFVGDPEYGGEPVFIVRDTAEQKLAVLSINLHYSNLPMLIEFSAMMYNLFYHFFPSTLTSYVFDVNEDVAINARGHLINLSGPGNVFEIVDTFPHIHSFKVPGVYTVFQPLMSGQWAIYSFFVRIPRTESDFSRTEVFIPPSVPEAGYIDWDLIIFFAAALVAFLFAERLLNIKGDQI